jgi:hypothetical protein
MTNSFLMQAVRMTFGSFPSALSRSRIKDFFAGNAEDTTRKEAFTLDADEPTIAAGQSSSPNSMEYLLH